VLHALVAYKRLRAQPGDVFLAFCDSRLMNVGPAGAQKMPTALIRGAAQALRTLGGERLSCRALLLSALAQREEGKVATPSREVWLAPRTQGS